jgi:hypothetical protein
MEVLPGITEIDFMRHIVGALPLPWDVELTFRTPSRVTKKGKVKRGRKIYTHYWPGLVTKPYQKVAVEVDLASMRIG